MENKQGGKHKLTIGPWTHYFWETETFGDFTVPQEGRELPIDLSMPRWFAHYLKGEENGLDLIDSVLYYVMGPFDGTPSSGNVWRTADTWPIPSINTPWFLNKEGGLTPHFPSQSQEQSYQHDPQNPIPTIGGANLFLASGPKDQRPIESRNDILLFTSEALSEDLEITGPITATIYFRTDQSDSDIVLRLCDVYPDGKSILLADATFRLDVMHHPYQEKSKQGESSLPCTIDLGSTSFVFAKGHAIRLSVSSSNFPRYEVNRGIAVNETSHKPPFIAKNTLHIGGDFPSQLHLPIVRQGEHWLAKKENPPSLNLS